MHVDHIVPGLARPKPNKGRVMFNFTLDLEGGGGGGSSSSEDEGQRVPSLRWPGSSEVEYLPTTPGGKPQVQRLFISVSMEILAELCKLVGDVNYRYVKYFSPGYFKIRVYLPN